MTFAAFLSNVRRAAFPDGEAENLLANHRNFVVDALIDLQMKVKNLQVNHLDSMPASESHFHCGASLFTAPRGFIQRIWTETSDACCAKVYYDPVTKDEIDCQLQEIEQCDIEHPTGTYFYGDEYYAYSDLGYCDETPDATIDKTCRADSGSVTLHRQQFWVVPHLQSDESLFVEWDGIKREYSDTDIVTDDRSVQQAVEYYLIGMAALREDCDKEKAEKFYNESMNNPGLYQIKVADMMWLAERELRMPRPQPCFTC